MLICLKSIGAKIYAEVSLDDVYARFMCVEYVMLELDDGTHLMKNVLLG